MTSTLKQTAAKSPPCLDCRSLSGVTLQSTSLPLGDLCLPALHGTALKYLIVCVFATGCQRLRSGRHPLLRCSPSTSSAGVQLVQDILQGADWSRPRHHTFFQVCQDGKRNYYLSVQHGWEKLPCTSLKTSDINSFKGALSFKHQNTPKDPE